MTKFHYLALAAALPLAAFVSWQLGGREGAGVLVGAFAAAAVCIGGLAWQDRELRKRPAQAMTALVVTFLVKLALVAGGAFALRFRAEAYERADWRSYLLAFIAVALWAMAIGSLRQVRPHAEVRAS